MKTTGWLIGVAALGMMFSLTASEIIKLDNWHSATSPEFIGTQLAHMGSVIAAFIGGKLIPTESSNGS